MSGYKSFTAGERLFAADVNDFLMEQSVMTFADAAARTAALAGVLREGILTYNEDTAQLEVYDGTDFVVAAPPQNLVAVKSALFTGTQSASVTTGNNVAVTNLSITHTLAAATNRLIISAYFGAAGSSEGRGNVGISVADDGTLVGIGDADGSRTRVGAGGFTNITTSVIVTSSPAVTFVYEPGDVVAHTFTVRAINISAVTRTLFINRAEDNFNGAERPLAASSLVIQEVKV
jgi:hypothetical protein